VAGPVERFRKSVKDSLDRRYVVHEQVDVLRTELESVSLTVDALRVGLEVLVERVGHVVQQLEGVEKVTSELGRRLEEVVVVTRPSVDFNRVALPALEVQLAYAHRLATESALAIEELLQQEVLIRRDLTALLTPH
jgi:hypothetical protein